MEQDKKPVVKFCNFCGIRENELPTFARMFSNERASICSVCGQQLMGAMLSQFTLVHNELLKQPEQTQTEEASMPEVSVEAAQ
jgi:hypothetical protein